MSVVSSTAAPSAAVSSTAGPSAARSSGGCVDDATAGASVAAEAGESLPVDVRAEVVSVGRVWAGALHRLVHLVAELDRSGEWGLDGSRSCAHWVASVLDVEVCTAREWLRIGRRLEGLPQTDAAWGTGRVSYSKVRQLTRVATVDCEAELLEIAERTPAGRLGVELARWRTAREEPGDTDRRHREARGVSWRTEADGMVVATVRLAPADAAVVIAAIDSWVMAYRGPGHASADAPVDDGSALEESGHASADASAEAGTAGEPEPGSGAWPSVTQQRADALVELVSGGGAAVTTEVVLHVRGDGCSLDDGTPVAGSVVERLVPGSFLRALIHDAAGRPIDASGRHRHPTTRQKRVVRERDRGCVDCGARALLELDHDPPFAVSGRTVIAELHQRCWACHRARHALPAVRR